VHHQLSTARSQDETRLVKWSSELELSRPHSRTRPRGLSPESVQRAPPEGSQVALERPADNLVMVAKNLVHYYFFPIHYVFGVLLFYVRIYVLLIVLFYY